MGQQVGEVTALLARLSSGDKNAATELIPYVYSELHRLAQGYMRDERPGHTLQPTALVNEAFLHLVKDPEPGFQSRAHFFGVAAHLMRQILVDYARRRKAVKRGGLQQMVPLESVMVTTLEHEVQDLLDLNEALDRLGQVDDRLSVVVEMRYFGGLTIDETAAALGVSAKTVKRDWQLARSWLRAEMGRTFAGQIVD